MAKYRDLIKRIKYLESCLLEGGASGHMKHIYDYTDLSLKEIKDIINNLFSGKVEDVTEKLDGMNIQCTVNNDGNVVFVRNKGDLNSPTGGMSRDDVETKWAEKPRVANVYLNAYDTIEKVLKKVGKKLFNPDKNTKILANCECINAGKTNIIPYASSQVDFHNLWVYTRDDENSPWEKSDVTEKGIETLERACKNVDGAQLTPRVLIKVTDKSNELSDEYVNKLNNIFSVEGLSDSNTIDDYRRERFFSLCNDKYKWITENKDGANALYNRWFNDDKSVNLRDLKKIYADHKDDLSNINPKQIVFDCMRPIDIFFSRLGNSIISLCNGIANSGAESDVTDQLKNDLEEITNEVKSKGSDELKDALTKQLNRLSDLGNQINATEGIVFRVGDKLMKVTGSFAALNQILGLRFRM